MINNDGTLDDFGQDSIDDLRAMDQRVLVRDRSSEESAATETNANAERRENVDRGVRRVLNRQALITICAVAVLLAILALGGLFSATPASKLPDARTLPVETISVKQSSSYHVQRSYLGTIEARQSSKLSFEVDGKLLSISVDEGTVVKVGTLLATLDTEILRSNRESVRSRIASAQAKLDELIAGPRKEDIRKAEAEVRRWQSQLKLAQITTARLSKLTKSRSIGQQEADDAIYNEKIVAARLELAEAQLSEFVNGTRKEQVAAQQAIVEQLESELRSIEINIEKSSLYAPFSGVIAQRRLDEGEVILSGQPVLDLLDNQHLEARVGVPVQSIASVKESRSHQLLYQGNRFSAQLKSVRPEKNGDTRTVDVVFSFDASVRPATVGDLVSFPIVQQIDQSGFWIPTSALTETYRGMWGCFVAEAEPSNLENVVSKLRELEVLHQDGDRTFVRGSLEPGDQVVVSGAHRLVSDQKLKLTMPPSAIASNR